MSYSKIPFDTKDFVISSARGVSLECLWDCSREAASASDADESEPNKFYACFGSRVAPLPPAEVQNVFLLAASTPATEVFTVNLLLSFKALARASS
jgi:hypothetical protein